MTITTGVSSTLRRPQTFHTFLYSYAVASLVPLPLRMAIAGTMASTGTAVAGTIYEITEPEQADTLFGTSSELALGCRMALAVGARIKKGPKVFAVAVAANAGGTAGVQTLTATGTVSADCVAIIEVAGRVFPVGLTNGDVQNTVATKISNALKTRQAELPFTVSVATNVVTLTVPHKGVNGLDLKVTVAQNAVGSSIAQATSATAAGVNDLQGALDALRAIPVDGVSMANHASADITEVNTDIATTWNAAQKRWRYYGFGEPGSIGTATALASAANHQAVMIASMEGCKNTALEMAVALIFALLTRERPNAIYNGLTLPLYPPAAATIYTPDEVETAIAAGLTPLTAEIDPFTKAVSTNVARIERMITTKTTVSSNPFEVLRDVGISRTGVWIAQQVDAAYAARASADADPDGEASLQSDDTIAQLKGMIRGIVRLAEKSKILRNVTVDLARLRVERDETAIGRTNADIPYTVVVGQHQFACVHRVQV